MSEQNHQGVEPLTRAERKELLVLACTSDRLAWLRACRPSPARSPMMNLAASWLGRLEPFSHFLPGRLGRWVRGAVFVAGLERQFGWLTR